MMVKKVLNTKFYALKSFLMVVLVLAGVLIPFFIFALIDDFNPPLYNLGDLDGQNGWWQRGGDPYKAQVIDSPVISGYAVGQQSTSATDNLSRKYAEFLPDGIQIFYIRGSNVSWERSAIGIGGDVGLSRMDIGFKQGCIFYGSVYNEYNCIKSAQSNTWYKIEVEWRDSDKKFRFKIDEDDWTDWVNSYNPQISMDRITIYSYRDEGSGFFFVDDLSSPPIYEPPIGIEPIITAESPIECDWNQAIDWIFDFKGKIEIPTDNPNAYTKFLLRLYVRQPMEMGLSYNDITFTEFPELKAGEMWEWNFEDFEILPNDNGFSLTYWLEGYNLETLKSFRWALLPIDICGKQTVLSDKPEFPVGLIPTEWIEMIYEDCSALTGFEKIMCDFTNWAKSIFAPSKEQLDALNQDINQIQTKFPFTYISSFFSFLIGVKNGVNEETGIPVKILGKEGNVNFDFFKGTGMVGGVVMSFSTIFKILISLMILFGFSQWLIGFLNRIL